MSEEQTYHLTSSVFLATDTAPAASILPSAVEWHSLCGIYRLLHLLHSTLET
jgi:hypothetical protein